MSHPPLHTLAWQRLKHYAIETPLDIKRFFTENPQRPKDFSRTLGAHLLVDFSKQAISPEILSCLYDLASECQISVAIQRFFAGEHINVSEDRPAWHVALRAGKQVVLKPYSSQLEEAYRHIQAQRAKMAAFVDDIAQGKQRGCTGKMFTDVVHLGIGGSDLGPLMACKALQHYQTIPLRTHFVGNIDPAQLSLTLKKVVPDTTLFICCSKTFTTQETMANATWCKQVLTEAGFSHEAQRQHWVAVTAAPDKASAFGIDPERIFEFADFIGGRFSVWSPIGLTLNLYIGNAHFDDFLRGAEALDYHFQTAPIQDNIPITLALIDIWNQNFLGRNHYAVVPYSAELEYLVPYLQQLVMESLGKSVQITGEQVSVPTGSVIWGQPGTNAQHAFFQHVHQGTHITPIDFIGFARSNSEDPYQHQRILLANMLAQASALMQGQPSSENQHRHFPGNRPSTTLILPQLTPYYLGMLLALYEHKVFVCSKIWNINAFDQFGVELGKKLAHQTAAALQTPAEKLNLDLSTQHLLEHLQNISPTA
jgi:glucose-6-phosphate isomerase